MLQSRILRTDPMQALSHQSFIIRLNVKGQGPERLPLNLKLHWCYKKTHHNIYSCWWNSELHRCHGSTHKLRLDPRRTISFRHMQESSSIINHTRVPNVRYAGYQCLYTSLAAWSILWRVGGIFIFFFQGSPHSTCNWERCGLNVQWQSAYEANAGARPVVPHHQWAAGSGTFRIGGSTGSQK